MHNYSHTVALKMKGSETCAFILIIGVVLAKKRTVVLMASELKPSGATKNRALVYTQDFIQLQNLGGRGEGCGGAQQLSGCISIGGLWDVIIRKHSRCPLYLKEKSIYSSLILCT